MRDTSILTRCFAITWVALASTMAADPPTKSSPLVTTESPLDDTALVSADAEWNWTFKSADDKDERTLPARKVVRWGDFTSAVGGHRVRLQAGGEIVGYSIGIADREVTLESDLLDLVRLPRDSAAAVIFDMPTDVASARALEKRIAAATHEQDTLLLANGDRLAGELVALVGDKLTLKTAEADFVVDRSRAAAVVFGNAPAPARDREAVKAWIGLRDGSRWLADKLQLKDERATIELAANATVSVKRDAIVALQPIGGDAVYLSDLTDAGYRHIPFLSLAWDYARDKNVTGGPLVADGRLYLKGLGMHSAARITYDLDGEYRAFQSELAIDDSTAGLPRAESSGRGSVTCRVFVDEGAGKWQLKYESPLIRGGEKPVPLNIDLTGAKRISLLVDFADRGDEQDHINWLEARLIK